MVPLSRLLVRAFFSSIVLCATIIPLLANSSPAAGQEAGTAPYIVVLKPNAGDPEVIAPRLAKRLKGKVGVKRAFRYALNGFATNLPPGLAKKLAAAPEVQSVEVDQPVYASAQTLPTGIDRIDVDKNATAKIDGIDDRVNADVAVLDTGVGPHTDLNVVGGKDCTGVGYYRDDNGHGSHVAGTIGALDNGSGVVGVAPGARIWSVKVLDRTGSGLWSYIICGLDWVRANSGTISVANMSLGGSGSAGTSCSSSSLRLAICNLTNAGVTVVAAAGNSSANVSGFVPASFPEVIAVSALADFDGKPGGIGSPTCRAGIDDGLADFSNFGAGIAIAAPGVCILSTWLNNGYATISGTSMASPPCSRSGCTVYR